MNQFSHTPFCSKNALIFAGVFAALIGGCSLEYPNCDTDQDCKSGEFCVDTQCQQCRGDSDCAAGESCNAGACDAIAGWCGSDSECPSGQECQGNECVATQSVAPPPIEAPVASCSLQSVYFGYDSSTLEGSSRDQLANNAECAREKNLTSIHLTGLTDPRGTEEYNMALGDRRAQTAKKYLKSLGVSAKVSHSSMGEELATGEDESGWSRDRRVDVKER